MDSGGSAIDNQQLAIDQQPAIDNQQPATSRAALAPVLADEHRAIDALADELDAQVALLVSGDHRLLADTTHRISQAVDVLSRATAARALVAMAAAELVGVPEDADLATIVGSWPAPEERRQLQVRCDAMRASTARLGEALAHNRRLLAHNLAAIGDALALLGTQPGYDATGSVDRPPSPPRLLDARA